ncbi:hypothetical protein SAMN04488134_109133 [Amphibacillus marinus]|uniref:Flp pilus-assembly TadE/G-like n=1 Tax=Amphibacillus marinus TaxID=872970 RepID=A0A1H8R2X6_9BACI|nr:DUF5702 domain-containing protein [Amphibacillus marinus]SEO60762.1 hypothetical protein SAMN04488134_109133 [Amphibacillus marinus]
MKRWLRKFKEDPKGSVSLFFILITAIVFAFNAILIDYARILAVEQQTEYALQSAVRSALAGHDSELRKYGLFGIEESDAQAIFNEVISANLEVEPDDQYFDYIQPNLEDYSLTASRPLSDEKILKHQILEEMKYKAPIEIAINLIDNFSFLAEAMKSASEFIDIAEAVQKPFENREELLDKSDDFLNGGEEREIGINDRLESFQLNMNSTSHSDYPDVRLYSDIVYHYQTYLDTSVRIERLESENDRLDIANERLEERKRRLEQQIQDLEDDISDEEDDDRRGDLEDDLEDLQDDIDEIEKELDANKKTIEDNNADIEQEQQDQATFKEKAEKKANEMYTSAEGIIRDLEEISNSIGIAKEENQKIIKAIEKAEEQSNENYGDVMSIEGDTPTDTSDIDDAVAKMREEMEKVKDYPYEPEYFDQIKTPLDEALEAFDGVPDILRPVKNNINGVSKSSLEDGHTQLKAAADTARESTTEGSDHLTGERKDFEQDENKEEENRAEAENSNDEIFNELSSLENLITEEVYNELSAILASYNAHAEGIAGGGIDYSDGSSNSAKGAMGLLDSLFSDLGKALLNARDELYVNEYILMYFESAKPKVSLAHPENFEYKNRQVEYIIYGLHEPGANYAAALAQLFAVRFAVNFIDAFKHPLVRAATHPLAVFLAALRYSLMTSLEDLQELGKGEPVLFMSNMIPLLEWNYHDYLRLFLFMNPTTQARYRRIAAVIEHDTKKKLTEHMTYVEGNARSSKQLLFVPEIAQMLNHTGILNGSVEGNQFKFERNAHFSY